MRGFRSWIAIGIVILFLGLAAQPAVNGEFPDRLRTSDTQCRGRDDVPAPFRELSALVKELLAVTTDTTDSDGDTLPDSVELVIGTDPKNNDTDFDRLNDSREVELELDPNKPDSNDDRMPDLIEVDSVKPDLDGDGVPNGWDQDNDDDGVRDGQDLSPFSRTGVSSSFDIDVSTGGKPTYIKFQLRTARPDHLGLIARSWDWPDDTKGQMRDLDGSVDDIVMTAVLKLSADVLPGQLEVADYGIIIGDGAAYIPLFPQFEYGNLVALQGKMFFPEGAGLENISGGVELLWRVSGFSDSPVKSVRAYDGMFVQVNATGAVRADAGAVSEEGTFEVASTGPEEVVLRSANRLLLRVATDSSVSANSTVMDGACTFALESPSEGKTAFRSLFNDRYLSVHPGGALAADAPEVSATETFTVREAGYRQELTTLAVYPDDFMMTGWSVEENFGSEVGIFYGSNISQLIAANLVFTCDFLRNASVALSDVPGLLEEHELEVGNRIDSYSHKDEALDGSGGEKLEDILDSLPDGEMLPVTFLCEQRSARFDLDRLASGDPVFDGVLEADLKSRPVATQRSLRTCWYNTSDDRLLDMEEVLTGMSGWGLPRDSLATLYGLTLTWDTGDHTTTRVGSENVSFKVPEHSKIGDMLEAIRFSGLYMLISLGNWLVMIPIFAHWMAYGLKWIYSNLLECFNLENKAFFTFFTKAITWVEENIPPWSSWNPDMTFASKLGNVWGSILSFIANFQAEWSPTAIGLAPAYIVLSIVKFVLDGIMAFIFMNFSNIAEGVNDPFVKPILYMLDNLLGHYTYLAKKYLTGKLNELMGKILNGLCSVFSRQKSRSDLGLDIINASVDIGDTGRNGLTVGDSINYTAHLHGNVSRTSNGTATDVSDSYIIPRIQVQLPDGTWTDRGISSVEESNTSDDHGKSTIYECGNYIEPHEAMVNYPMNMKLRLDYRTFYDDCWWLVVWICKRMSYTGSMMETWNTLHFDVLPEDLEGFLDWRGITSRDADGDGLNDTAENETNPWLWDTDGDGIGDAYEAENGYDPLNGDTDGDGSCDLTELEVGTNLTNKDTDGDGLEDGQEYAGWVVTFEYCASSFNHGVSSDPRLNNTDGDALDDRMESLCLLDPRSGDTDGDGTPDGLKDYYVTEFEYETRFGNLGDVEPVDVAVDKNGYIYETRVGTPDDGFVIRWNEDLTLKDLYVGLCTTFRNPKGITNDSDGNLWVADAAGRVINFDTTLKVLSIWTKATGDTNLSAPSGIAVDSEGYVYVTDTTMHNVQKFNSTGKCVLTWGGYGTGDGQFNGPTGIALDGEGRAFVADSGNHRIQVFDANGTFTGKWGTFGAGLKQFNRPWDVAIDQYGDVIVSDRSNLRIQKFDVKGNYIASIVNDSSGQKFLYGGARGLTAAGSSVFVVSYYDYDIVKIWNNVTFVPAVPVYSFADTDGDGLADGTEEAGWSITVTNSTGTFEYNETSDPMLADTDGDGLGDQDEYNLSTDPRKTDTDGDGLMDSEESATGGRSSGVFGPGARTSGANGRAGRAGSGTNATNWDTDGDGLPDGVEMAFRSDPLANDTDGEGLSDKEEFELGSDPASNDTDGDGLEDPAEKELGSSLTGPDTDGDSLFDAVEAALGTDLHSNDTDGDGLDDWRETAFETNGTVPDSDGDGLPDGLEVDRLLDPLSNDTDGDNLTDSEELERGLDPLWSDSDGDGVPDALDEDYALELDDKVVLVMDPGPSSEEFAAKLAGDATVVLATPSELMELYTSSPHVVLVGRPDAENGTAGAITGGLLAGTGEVLAGMLSSDYQNLAVRYGVWTPTQTVVMLSRPLPGDAIRVLGILKSMMMTVTENSITAQYLNHRACFRQDDLDTVRTTDSYVWTKLDDMAVFNVSIARYGPEETPAGLTAAGGLEAGDIATGKYLGVEVSDNLWSEGVDRISGAHVRLFYTEDDLDRTGDGDADDPEDLDESTLALYWYDEAAGTWLRLSDSMDWVNGTGLNTTNISLYGRDYAGCIWADVEHLSLYGVAGKVNGGLEVVARAGEDIDVDVGAEVLFNGTLSSGNGPILNYTWTFSYDNRTVTLYGPASSFVFQVPGTYSVALTVTDSLALSATDMLTVTVRERPGGKWLLRVGPVTDENVTALRGALVKLIVGGETFSNTTDASGFALFELRSEHVSKGVAVIVAMEGYIPAEYSTNITAARVLERNPPPLVWMRPGEEFTLTLGPIKDTNGRTLEGAQVTITVGGQTHTNTTDARGLARFVLPLARVGKDINVKIGMKGYNAVEYDTRISADRVLDQNPPAMEKAVKPAPGAGPPMALWVAAAAVVIIVALAGVLFWRKRRPPVDREP